MNTLNETPQGMRTAIAFLGRRNAGKSSLLNTIVGYELAIVSDIAGTTADPVKKAVEIHPLGPCLVIDTAGLDDSGMLGEKRIRKTQEIIKDIDVGLIVIGDGIWTEYEQQVLDLCLQNQKEIIVVLSKADTNLDTADIERFLTQKQLAWVHSSVAAKNGTELLVEKVKNLKSISKMEDESILGDVVKHGDLVLMVVPLDLSAPKGRLILPQVQILRNTLDIGARAMVVKLDQLESTIEKFGDEIDLVITDSQVVLKVNEIVPPATKLTTFSILFSRFKGDLQQLLSGVKQIDMLNDGDKILIAEACTHHSLEDDIGRVKIPNWVREHTKKDLQFEIAAGPNFIDNLKGYSLILQCGGCTITKRAYINRINAAKEAEIPITNYGLAISFLQGVLSRVIEPFPETAEVYANNNP